MGEHHDLGPVMQILIPVSDIDAAAEFYEKVLGFHLLFRFPGNAFFDADGVRLYLAKPDQPGFQGRASIYFRVEDVTGTLARLESAGAKVIERPNVVFSTDEYDLWLAFVRDPDGNNIGLMREAPVGTERG